MIVIASRSDCGVDLAAIRLRVGGADGRGDRHTSTPLCGYNMTAMASRSDCGVGLAATAEGGCPDLVRVSAEVGPMATSWR